MRTGSKLTLGPVPTQVAPGRYIQNIIHTRKPDMSWIAVNNVIDKQEAKNEIHKGSREEVNYHKQ